MRNVLALPIERHPIIGYTLARLGLLVLVLVLLALVGFRGLALIGLAALVSGGLSLILLDGLRSRYSSTVAEQFRRINDRIDSASRTEDEADESMRAQGDAQGAVQGADQGAVPGPATAAARED